MRLRVLLAPLCAALLGISCASGSDPAAPAPVPSPTPTPYAGPPNLIVILADDMGYGDLSGYGSATIKTPNIDKMMAEGMKLSGFSVPVPLCAPSRAGLMTGRYPAKVGIPWNPPVRLHDGELTIADLLKPRGYATAIFGKWHLGWDAGDMPVHHGFDVFVGTSSGDDRDFWRGDKPAPDGPSEDQVTGFYTQQAIQWMQSVKDRPFFLYLAHHAPHVPLFASPPFLGKSAGGLYGDVVQELDASVGDVLKTVKDLGLDQRTLVIFLSDNGPDRQGGAKDGSAGPFSGFKGSCLEGGLRVPAIARWPGWIPAGKVNADNTSSLDLLPTFVSLARGSLPADRTYYGLDITRLLTGEQSRLAGPGIDGGRELIHYYSTEPVAIRTGRYKYLAPGFWSVTPGLFDLEADPSESNDLRATRPDVADRLKARLQAIHEQVVNTP
jgi:arylsulfatase